MTKMTAGKACAIFMQIDSKDYTDEEKAIAIHEVMNMPTHMSITKDAMVSVIKHLWHKKYVFETEEEVENASMNPMECHFAEEKIKSGLGAPERGVDWCSGYQKSATNDEPCERCQRCKEYSEGEEEQP